MKKLKTLLVFAVILGAAAAFFFLSPGGLKKLTKDTNVVEEEITFPVKVIPATEGSIQEYIRLSGDVQASSTIDVMPDASGKLSRIKVKEGRYVSKGQILAYIDPSRPGANFVESPVKAPISGTITKIYGRLGGLAAQSMPLFQIGQLKNLEVTAFVAERHTWKVKVGQSVLLSAHAVPGRQLTGVVSEVAPVIDSQTRTMEITITIGDDAQYLKAGMLAELTLITKELKNIIRVPVETLIKRAGKDYVFVITNDKTVELRTIEIGIIVNGFTHIVSGLSADELIVYSGQSLLSEGSVVDIVDTAEGLPAEGNIRG